MANVITNYREVKYDMETKLDALHWDDFIHEVKCTWFEGDDYYAVYENLDEEDDHERRKYAVYLHSTGELICLIADSGLVLDSCYDDQKYMYERDKLYKQIALLAGWPERLPAKKSYTVQLKRTINVKVYADSYAQAEWIGRNLAACDTEWKCMVVNEAMCNGDDSFDGVYKPTERSWWHLNLTESECDKLLKED